MDLIRLEDESGHGGKYGTGLPVGRTDGIVKSRYGEEFYKPQNWLFSLKRSGTGEIVTISSSSFHPPKTKRSGFYVQ